MATKVFLDTNIILDLLDNKRHFHKDSVGLFKKIDEKLILAFISESVICNTDYILQILMSKEERNMFFVDLLEKIDVLQCSTLTVKNALNSSFLDLEDVILYQIALENGINYFITNDTKLLEFSKNGSLKTVSPSGFLAKIM